jgi:hypothetical protein
MYLAVTPEGYAAAVGSAVAEELTDEIDALFQQTGIFLDVSHVRLPSTNQWLTLIILVGLRNASQRTNLHPQEVKRDRRT